MQQSPPEGDVTVTEDPNLFLLNDEQWDALWAILERPAEYKPRLAELLMPTSTPQPERNHMIPAPEGTEPNDDNEGHFVDIVITDDSDRSILPDAILYHLRAGGDKAAEAELDRRAEEELDAEMRELEAEQAARAAEEADEKP